MNKLIVRNLSLLFCSATLYWTYCRATVILGEGKRGVQSGPLSHLTLGTPKLRGVSGILDHQSIGVSRIVNDMRAEEVEAKIRAASTADRNGASLLLQPYSGSNNSPGGQSNASNTSSSSYSGGAVRFPATGKPVKDDQPNNAHAGWNYNPSRTPAEGNNSSSSRVQTVRAFTGPGLTGVTVQLKAQYCPDLSKCFEVSMDNAVSSVVLSGMLVPSI
jgi:hypothetical protein